MKTLFVIVILALLTGCAGSLVPVEIVDYNQITSRENAQENAQLYIAEVYPNAGYVSMYADSTINQQCRYGDGWASGMVFQNGQIVARIKCQTNGMGKGIYGCLTESDWQHEYGHQRTRTCNKNITEIRRFK